MNENDFLKYLKKRGKKEKVAEGLINQVRAFEVFLIEKKRCRIENAKKQDIKEYAKGLSKKELKDRMRGLALYYRFIENNSLVELANKIREGEISKTRKSFKLKEFRGVEPDTIDKLMAIGIITVDDMLAAGKTPDSRKKLAKQTSIPSKVILELVKLSDLSRLGAVKSVRARLYYEAGLDTPHKFAKWETDELRKMLIDFVEKTGFDGIPPLPKELRNAIATAWELPHIIIY